MICETRAQPIPGDAGLGYQPVQGEDGFPGGHDGLVDRIGRIVAVVEGRERHPAADLSSARPDACHLIAANRTQVIP